MIYALLLLGNIFLCFRVLQSASNVHLQRFIIFNLLTPKSHLKPLVIYRVKMRVLYSLDILEIFKWLTSPTASVNGQ